MITTIVTHGKPHLDELSAIWALRRYGTEIFPGVDTASIERFDPEKHDTSGPEHPWLDQGYLFLGCGGYRFDDHPHEKFPNDCVFTMICDALGFAENRAWRDLQRYILREDKQAKVHSLHLAALIKSIHNAEITDIDTVLGFVELALDAFLKCQEKFWAALEYLQNNGTCYTVRHGETGRELKLVVVDSTDNTEIAQAARFERGLDADLVIHRNKRGQVYISPNKRKGMRQVDWLAAQLRFQEQQFTSFPGGKVCDFCVLTGDGMLHNWYHQKGAGAIMNGSSTATHVPPTKLALDSIVRIAMRFLEGCRLAEPEQRNGSQS